ncbi:hypothetical protein [Litoribacillus peritrichatus]|uniref:ATP-grasp domain-containing protein n=1 Tax=Litoribacillus peritrichatus TaxID=718191 RepID=A0ABP7MAS7_9GAMM
MMIRLLLIVSYILSCLRLRVGPWRYFQLNASYFNENKGIYSKLDIDNLIPEQWRLQQWVDGHGQEPTSYPVFVKPEWGQNSKGIQRADNAEALNLIRSERKPSQVQHLVQEAATGKIEFEIFAVPSENNIEHYQVLSITKVLNDGDAEFPINGIYNKHTHYQDITDQFSDEDLDRLWAHLKQIGQFRISRFGVRADSIKALLDGRFKVIEINLFLPMPLVLLTKNTSVSSKFSFVFQCMWLLAKVTKTIPVEQNKRPIFFQKLNFIRRVKHIAQKEAN